MDKGGMLNLFNVSISRIGCSYRIFTSVPSLRSTSWALLYRGQGDFPHISLALLRPLFSAFVLASCSHGVYLEHNVTRSTPHSLKYSMAVRHKSHTARHIPAVTLLQGGLSGFTTPERCDPRLPDVFIVQMHSTWKRLLQVIDMSLPNASSS